MKACISPCGSLVLCGGEDSVLNVWNLETGKHLAKYTNKWNYQAVTCIDYHPYNHILAFSIFGSPTSVQVLKFNKNANDSDVGLKIIRHETQSYDNKPNTNEWVSSFQSKYPTVMEEACYYERNQILLIPSEETLAMRHSFAARSWRKTNHLRHIIEKIDKMLFIMRLKRIEHPITVNAESVENNLYKQVNYAMRMKEEKQFDKTKLFVNNRARPSPSVKSFNLPFSGIERHQIATKGKPGSAKESAIEKVIDQEQLKTLSDNVANSPRFQSCDDSSLTFVVNMCENIAEDNTTVRLRKQNCSSDSKSDSNSAVISIDETNMLMTPQKNMSDSAGTYVIDVMDYKRRNAEENVDLNRKFTANCVINVETKSMDFNEISGASENSISSHATFIIENETSVSKLRRNLQEDR